MFTFGSMTLLAACTQNFGGMFALRFFLGMAESGFFPLVIYYLTTFYRRGELARRLAVFYAASNIANAFSGLLSFGVFQIDSKIFVWRYLFIIEGSASVLFSIFAFWYLPRSAAQAKFLGEEEKALAFHRMQVDSSSVVQEKFNFKDSIKIFTYPTTYCFLLIEICLGVPIQSVALFMPQIIQRLGYGPVKTNLYTGRSFMYCTYLLLLMPYVSCAKCRWCCDASYSGFQLRFSTHSLPVHHARIRPHVHRLHHLRRHLRRPSSITIGILCMLHDGLGNICSLRPLIDMVVSRKF
ncbi:hypothetical protein V3481_000075 [Fusarium oxysporum f. sp. vasinfectum]